MEQKYVIAITAIIFVILYYYFFVYNVITVYMFYGDGCGFCTEMKPQWEIVKEKINDEKMGMGYVLYDINIADPKYKELVSKYKVQGVPYIVKVNTSDKSDVFTGPRKFKEIKEWIQAK